MSNPEKTPKTAPLLTIAIPTWNRAAYLKMNLAQLRSELAGVDPDLVEIIVSDNCSPDSTTTVVEEAVNSGLPVRYIRNEKNLGWALNFAQAFDLSRGKHVLLCGDDDLFVDGALAVLLRRLEDGDYGVICLRPYGYDDDFRQEYPGKYGREREFQDANQFLIAISRYFTLTSACIINKSQLPHVNSMEFISTDLAAFHLVLRAALSAKKNLFIDRYMIASKRQNSFAYEYTDVFVSQLWRIIDAHIPFGLQPETVRTIERDKLLSYYPFYMLDLRLSGRGNLKAAFDVFASRFHDRWLFKYWLAPIIRLPRPLAIAWGAIATVIGRIKNGEARRGIKFALNKLVRYCSEANASAAQPQSLGRS